MGNFNEIVCNKFIGLAIRGYLKWIPDEIYLKIMFWLKLGYPLNIKKPVTFNEKLNWLKLYHRKNFHSSLVDKFEVRKYIADTIGKEYLVPLIGYYSRFDEIDFDNLPGKFVLKCTHGSHCLVICTDKSTLDLKATRKKFTTWNKTNYYDYAREWPYKNLRPKIICEQFISENGKVPADYKVFCFNGEPKLVRVDLDRFENISHNFFTTEWNRYNLKVGDVCHDEIPKPSCLEEMLYLTRRLANKMPHVRVDWYVVNEKLYFGEITFFDGGGMEKFGEMEQERLIGSWINVEDSFHLAEEVTDYSGKELVNQEF